MYILEDATYMLEETKLYTLEETQQIIKENPYTCIILPIKVDIDEYEELQEILDSTDNTREFKITSWLNIGDYPCKEREYYITELDI